MQKPKKIKFKAEVLPSLITVLSLFCGFLSIISSIKGNFEQSVQYILMAFVLDGLDGRVARKLNAASDFGKELDSLCDLVAFGVAPAILVWNWLFRETLDELGVLAAFIFVAGGATRLARFNIQASDIPKSYFVGLPIPAAAAALSSLVYAYPEGIRLPKDNWDWLTAWVVLAYTISLGLLMVSTFKFSSFKRLTLTDVDPRKLFVCLAAGVAFIWKFNRVSIFVLLLLYVASGIWFYVRPKKKSKQSTEEDKIAA